MNKRGIALSVNMLVVIIISLVIFGLGISLLFKLTEGAESAKASLDQKTDAELRRLLEVESKKVALPLHTAYLHPGDFHSFGLGILNIDKDNTEFEITIDLAKALDGDDNNMPDFNEIEEIVKTEWLLVKLGPYTIEEHEYELIPIGVNPPKTALKGTYIFDVKVYSPSQPTQYDTTKKFYVVVN